MLQFDKTFLGKLSCETHLFTKIKLFYLLDVKFKFLDFLSSILFSILNLSTNKVLYVYSCNINLKQHRKTKKKKKKKKEASSGKSSMKIDCFQECLLWCRLRSRCNEIRIVLVMMMLCTKFLVFLFLCFLCIIVHTGAIENMLQSSQDFYISLFSWHSFLLQVAFDCCCHNQFYVFFVILLMLLIQTSSYIQFYFFLRNSYRIKTYFFRCFIWKRRWDSSWQIFF